MPFDTVFYALFTISISAQFLIRQPYTSISINGFWAMISGKRCITNQHFISFIRYALLVLKTVMIGFSLVPGVLAIMKREKIFIFQALYIG